MKKHLFVLFALLVPLLCLADDYDKYVKMASAATNLADRFEYWLKAAEATKDNGKKLELYQTGFNLAKRLNEKERILQFGALIGNCPGVSDAIKADARYQSLMSLRISRDCRDVKSSDFEKFLTMPGRTPLQERDIMSKLASVYHAEDQWYREIALLEKLLNHPENTVYQKQDVLLALSRMYLSINNMNESVKYLEELLKPEMKLTPRRRADTLLLKGDTLLKGDGWYYMPDEVQYQRVKQCYLEAMSIKRQNFAYNQGIMKLVAAAKKMGKHQEVIDLSAKYLHGNGKKSVDKMTWMFVKNEEGNSQMALEHFKEAVFIFEKLYEYKFSLADTCMSLGQAYYRNRDYTMGCAMYDEALVELGRADDARPAICKHWLGRLKHLIGQKARIDAAVTAHFKRLNAEAAAQGKSAVAKIGEKDRYHLFGVPEKKSKQPPKSMKDVLAEDELDILSDGLDLD